MSSFVKLGDHCKLISGFAFKSKDLGTSGVPVVKIKNVNNKTVDLSDTQYFPEELITSKHDKFFLEKGDVLIAMTGQGSVGRVGRINVDNASRILLNQRVGKFSVAPTLDLGYLYYVLSSDYYENILFNAAIGSGQPNLSPANVYNVEIPYAKLSKQKAIAHILGSLDDKIELNRQINETLEAMAQALFKSWFVDFDPVIDNALAAGNPIPDVFVERAKQRAAAKKPENQSTSTTAVNDSSDYQHLFPAGFEFTEEMGWIPKGWIVGAFEDHSQIVMGQSPKGTSYNSEGVGTPLVNGPVEFGQYFTREIKWTTEPTKMSKYGDLIVCVRGSTTGRHVKSNGNYCLGRGVCSVRGKKSQSFSDYWFKSSLPSLLRFATGSTFPSWNGPAIKAFVSIVPSSIVMDKFESIVAPMLTKQGQLTDASLSLTKLRDTLLPKLLSGELRIPDAEKLVQEALL